MKLTKALTIILLLITLSPYLVLAENTITPVTLNQINSVPLSMAEVQDFYIREEIKTRNEFKTYTDAKITQLETWVSTKGQAMIDENFAVMDKRLHELATEIFIKFLIGAIAVIIFSHAIWYKIRTTIENKGKRATSLTHDEYTNIVAGIVTEEYKDTITKQAEAQKKAGTNTYPDSLNTIRIPTREEIEALLENKRNKKKIQEEQKKIIKQKEKEQAEKEKIQREEAKKQEKQLKKDEKIKKKLLAKQEELEKIKKELEPLQPAPLPPPIPPKLYQEAPNPPPILNTNQK